MKIALGCVVMILLASAPAHAQARGGAPPDAMNRGGGGTGGSISAPSSFPTLRSYPRANPQAIDVTGDDSFLPSRFVAFDTAVAEGKVILQEETKTVAQVAADSRKAAAQAKPTLQFAQDDRGNALISNK